MPAPAGGECLFLGGAEPRVSAHRTAPRRAPPRAPPRTRGTPPPPPPPPLTPAPVPRTPWTPPPPFGSPPPRGGSSGRSCAQDKGCFVGNSRRAGGGSAPRGGWIGDRGGGVGGSYPLTRDPPRGCPALRGIQPLPLWGCLPCPSLPPPPSNRARASHALGRQVLEVFPQRCKPLFLKPPIQGYQGRFVSAGDGFHLSFPKATG